MWNDFSTSLICMMIATVAILNGVVYVGEWYGFFCLMIAAAFATIGVLLWRT